MRPSLALGLIDAQLQAAGMQAMTCNLNFALGSKIGFGAYETIARFKGVETQVSEWLFAEVAWRRSFGIDEAEFLRLCGDELQTIPHVANPTAWLRKIRDSLITPYLESCYDRIMGADPRVVAFSCMFFQTNAALALARLLKERHPELTLAFGGASFHGEMGEELFEKTPWIDAVSTGEADDVVVPLFESLERGETPATLPGVLVRDRQGGKITGPEAVPTSAYKLELLPVPNYDSFFTEASRVRLTEDATWLDRVALPFEASRGCWWGQKKHCTFCGLNGDGMGFRAKSPGRVLNELEQLALRYPARNLQATDNIMAMDYFTTFLPRLADLGLTSRGRKVSLFFEVKPNLTRAHMQALADANVHYVQPGIESLSTHILKLIDKGVTALQNVFFLKCATQYGLVAIWNLLVRVPGEQREDYTQMEEWIPLLIHLRPPTGGAPRIECHRYSPYFFRKGVWLENVRPAGWYRGVFPGDLFDLNKVAYYFEAAWKDTLGDPAYDRVTRRVHHWMKEWQGIEVPQLTAHDEPDGTMHINDTRGPNSKTWSLSRSEADVYRAITDISTPRGVFAQPSVQKQCTEDFVGKTLLAFVEDGLALEENNRFLALALPPTTPPPLANRATEMRRPTNQRSTTVLPTCLEMDVR